MVSQSVNLGKYEKHARVMSGSSKQRGDSYQKSFEQKMRNDSRGKFSN